MSWLAALADKVFGFKGRLRRRDWWLITIGLMIVNYIAGDFVIRNMLGGEYGLVLLGLPFLWCGFVLGFKRFQDQDKSNKWNMLALIVAFVPTTILIESIALFWPQDQQSLLYVSRLMYWLTLPANIYVFMVAGFIDGTRGPNRFGPSPKAKEFAKVS